MPQKINMSDNPTEDIEKLDSTIENLIHFGILHMDSTYNTIEESFTEYLESKYSLSKIIEKDNPDFNEDNDYEDIKEYISDNMSVRETWEILFDTLTDEEKLDYALKYRDVIFYLISDYSDQEIIDELLK